MNGMSSDKTITTLLKVLSLREMRRLYNRKTKYKHIKPIKTAPIMHLWSDLHPKPSKVQIGDEINVPMKSGKTAIFKLTDIDFATNTDWYWYTMEFSHYQGE